MKKTILLVIALLMTCDVILMITAHAQQSDTERDLEQLRQLQQLTQPSQAVKQPANPPQATLEQRLQNAPAATPAASIPRALPVSPAPARVAQTSANDPAQSPVTTNPELAQKALDERAFREVVRNLMPLSQEQIMRLRSKYNMNELAKLPSDSPPKPVASTQIVQLAPGSTPPVIRLSKGYVSSVVFLDSTGAPWPIQDYDLGDPGSFNIQWDKKSNTLMIQARTLYIYGNLAVRLQGLQTPVMLTLIPGQAAVDYRADLRIHGLGPNARALPMQLLPESADGVLLSILDGVPPNGSKQLDVQGGEAQVWVDADIMFVRTRLKILSPGWLAYMSSADGMQVYKMQHSSTLLVALPEQGRTTILKITGW